MSTIETEEWRGVPTWPEYEASSMGRVRRVKASRGTRAGKILKQRLCDGYFKVSLSRNAQPVSEWVHRLVALAFHGVPVDPSHEVCHNDNDGTNNQYRNLRWDTRASNSADRVANGTHIRGESNPGAKLTEDQVREIRSEIGRGRTQSSIALDFGISRATVGDIATQKAWRHLN